MTRKTPFIDETQVSAMNVDNQKSSALSPAGSALSAADSSNEFSDTVIFKSPVIKPDREHLEKEKILLAGAAGSIGSPYKFLRTQVIRRMEQLGANTLAVISPYEGAGKTLTAINLAIAIAAETGRTALLVDLDLRHPSIHRRFGFEPKLGIEDCIRAHRPVQDAMVKIMGYDRLTVLPAKSAVDSSSELLTEQKAGELVNELRNRYANRVIIFDLPPVLQVDDALAFSHHVQAGLLVVAEGKTGREDVVRSMNVMQDLKIVGTVLNGAREVEKNYYY
jgi:capsular exopolysaccharide synthesis family protein